MLRTARTTVQKSHSVSNITHKWRQPVITLNKTPHKSSPSSRLSTFTSKLINSHIFPPNSTINNNITHQSTITDHCIVKPHLLDITWIQKNNAQHFALIQRITSNLNSFLDNFGLYTIVKDRNHQLNCSMRPEHKSIFTQITSSPSQLLSTLSTRPHQYQLNTHHNNYNQCKQLIQFKPHNLKSITDIETKPKLITPFSTITTTTPTTTALLPTNMPSYFSFISYPFPPTRHYATQSSKNFTTLEFITDTLHHFKNTNNGPHNKKRAFSVFHQPPLIVTGWTLFNWNNGGEDRGSGNNTTITSSPTVNTNNDNSGQPSLSLFPPDQNNNFTPGPSSSGQYTRKVVRFEKSNPGEKLPPPPTRDRSQLDEYGISIHNIFRFCSDDRLHQRFQVKYRDGDIHHNINEYRTFIEKERFYIQKDYTELLSIQNVFIRRLLQLHYVLGLRLEHEHQYKQQYKAKVVEDLLHKKRRILEEKLLENEKSGKPIPNYEIYNEYQIKLTQSELDAIDIDIFGDIRQSKLLPFQIRGGVVEDLIEDNNNNNNNKSNNNNNNEDGTTTTTNENIPPNPDDGILIDESALELIHSITQPHIVSGVDQLAPIEAKLLEKIPEKISTPFPKSFHQPRNGNLSLLDPKLLKWIEQIRGNVLFSMRSCEELSQALFTLNSTLQAFDQMVQDSIDIQEYKQEMNLLACQAAFITGTRQVVYNILKHSNNVLYEYEDFYTPTIIRYLASVSFEPHLHQDLSKVITPFHRHYYDEFTPADEVERIKMEQEIDAEVARQEYISAHTNRLANRRNPIAAVNEKLNNQITPEMRERYGDIFEGDVDKQKFNNELNESNTNFPPPPLLVIEDEKIQQAVQSFAQDMAVIPYEPISYAYRNPIKHNWTQMIDINDIQQQLHLRFIVPTHAIPPPQGYVPRPAELPVMSGIESNIPERFLNDNENYGWVNTKTKNNNKTGIDINNNNNMKPPQFLLDYTAGNQISIDNDNNLNVLNGGMYQQPTQSRANAQHPNNQNIPTNVPQQQPQQPQQPQQQEQQEQQQQTQKHQQKRHDIDTNNDSDSGEEDDLDKPLV